MMRLISPILTCLVLSMFLVSCSLEPEGIDRAIAVSQPDEGMIQLGAVNPEAHIYTLPNMQTRLDSVLEARGISARHLLTPTHYYYRFSPKNKEELDILHDDTTLTLFDYPMDRDVVVEGQRYHDPAVPPNQPTYQYTVLPVGQAVPANIEHEILKELFFPEEADDSNIGSVASKLMGGMSALFEEIDPMKKRHLERSNETLGGRPYGTIKVRDYQLRDKYPGQTAMYDVPIKRVKVTARRWFKWRYMYTGVTGSYSFSTYFYGRPRMRVEWRDNGGKFAIKANSIFYADLDGPRTYRWTPIIYTSHNLDYANIYLAAHDYYYGDRGGMGSPRGHSGNRMKIVAWNGRSGDRLGSHKRTSNFWTRLGAHEIKIYVDEHEMRNVTPSGFVLMYRTTIHELAHSAHTKVCNNRYCDQVFNRDVHEVERQLIESFANAVEWYFAKKRYGEKFPGWEFTYDGFEKQGTRYTTAIIDLMDNVNQAKRPQIGPASSCDDTSRPYDNISGYTMAEVWAQLQISRSFDELCTRLYNAYRGKPARGKLRRFFNQFSLVKGCGGKKRLKGRDTSVTYDAASACAGTSYPPNCSSRSNSTSPPVLSPDPTTNPDVNQTNPDPNQTNRDLYQQTLPSD